MGKLKLRIKDFKYGTATKDLEQAKTDNQSLLGLPHWLKKNVEQSKPPKEEQCDCTTTSMDYPKQEICPVCDKPFCQPKTVRDKMYDPLIPIEDQLPKTEDTGECIFCKASPHDLSCPNHPNKKIKKLTIKQGRELVKKIQKNKEESWEDRFSNLFTLRDLETNQPMNKKVKSFIQSEISKAVAKEREELIEKIKEYITKNTFNDGFDYVEMDKFKEFLVKFKE